MPAASSPKLRKVSAASAGSPPVSRMVRKTLRCSKKMQARRDLCFVAKKAESNLKEKHSQERSGNSSRLAASESKRIPLPLQIALQAGVPNWPERARSQPKINLLIPRGLMSKLLIQRTLPWTPTTEATVSPSLPDTQSHFNASTGRVRMADGAV